MDEEDPRDDELDPGRDQAKEPELGGEGDASRFRPWNEIRNEAKPSERNVGAFARLMEAETRLYSWWGQRHCTTWVTEVLRSPVEETTDLWLAALGEKVAAMGGHLELIAVFGNEALTLLKEPGPEGGEA